MNKQKRTIDILQEFSIPLISGVLLAIVWANLEPEIYFSAINTHLTGNWRPLGPDIPISLHFIANDALMVAFFGIAAKEIVESLLPGGALNPIKNAINPVLGTIGGVLGPILVFLTYVHFTGAAEIANGWAVPTATDIALAWLVAKAVFGKSHPAVSFLVLLAVIDDGIGLAIIATFYGDPAHPTRPLLLLLVLAGMVMAYFMKKRGVKNHWLYFLGPGTLTWWGLELAHLHPALAAVFVVPFMPSAKRDHGLYEEEQDGELDTLNSFEHAWKLPVDFGLFIFGLANAGVVFSDMGHATCAVLLGLLLGKMLGIFTFSSIGEKLGFPLPKGMDTKSLFVVSIVAGLGLTVALFVAGVAYTNHSIEGAAKMGALFSVINAPLAYFLFKLLKLKKAN